MNLEQIRENLRNQGAKVADLSARLAKAASDDKLDIAAVTKLQDELAAEQARYNALKTAASVDQPQPEALKPTKEDRTRSDMLKSNEYARAFAYAIRNGLTPATGRGREETQVLFDAMTIGGGDPAGTDGGFLVPTDIDTQIHEKLKEIAPLINYFGHEMVQAQAGWRVTDTAPTSGFSSINEAATVPSNQQPAFAKVTYSLTKYGLIVPVSNELVADETANLFAYLARWYAKKAAITINGLFLGVLDDLDSGATEIANNAILKGVKTLLNVNIDPAHAANAARPRASSAVIPSSCWATASWRPPRRSWPRLPPPRRPSTWATRRPMPPCSSALPWSCSPPTSAAPPSPRTPPRSAACSAPASASSTPRPWPPARSRWRDSPRASHRGGAPLRKAARLRRIRPTSPVRRAAVWPEQQTVRRTTI